MAATMMFAACSQEEIVNVENAPQDMKEVVGAKLIGTGFSMSVENDASSTRYADGLANKWDESDVIGLGWVVKGMPYEDQAPTEEPDKTVLYANHMFEWNEEAGEFSSRGNFYEGWHFAYYPWSHMPKVLKKRHDVNPDQMKCEEGQDPMVLRRSQALFISHKTFLDAETDVVDNQVSESFQMYPTMNFMNIRTTAAEGSAFAEGGDLADKTIKSVTVNVGQEIFADRVVLDPTELPTWIETPAEGKTLVETNKPAMDAALNGDLFVKQTKVGDNYIDGLSEAVTTNVEATGYKVSDATQLITIVTPAQATISETDVQITVTLTDNSCFEIVYINGAEEGTPAFENNQAILKLIKAWGPVVEGDAVSGVFTTANNQPVGFAVQLYEDIYNTDATFANISNIDEWTAAVDMVNALGLTEQTFSIDGKIQFTNSIPMPLTCVVNVVRVDNDATATQCFELLGTHTQEWPANLKSDNIRLDIATGTVVDNAHTIKASNIYNYGTLNVPEGGTKDAHYTLGKDGYATFNNGVINLNGMYAEVTDVFNEVGDVIGRINIVYGAYVTDIRDSKNGEIAYIVKNGDTPKMIQEVINTSGNSSGFANVNILSFDEKNLTSFNLTIPASPDAGDPENPYNPVNPDAGVETPLTGLENVDLEITGVEVKSTIKVTANNVTMTGATAKLENVNIDGNLKITGGGSVECTQIGGDVETDGTIIAETIVGDILKASGNLIEVTNVNGTVVEATGCTLKVTETIAGGITNATNCAITATNIIGDVTIRNSDITTDKIEGDVTITGSGNTLKVTEITGTVENNGTASLDNTVAASIGTLVNNAEFTSNVDVYVTDVTLSPKSITTLSDDVENSDWNKTIWYTGSYTFDKMTLNGTVSHYGASLLADEIANAENGATVTLKGDYNLDAYLSIDKEVTLDLNSKTVNRAGAVVVASTGATITITGNGTINAETREDGKSSQAIFANGGDVIIKNGTFTCDDDKNGKRNDMIYATEGTITINGGTFEYVGSNSDGAKYMLNCLDGSGAKIIVNGGKFKNCVPAYEEVGVGEVELGTDKKVYKAGTDEEVAAPHSGADMWYEVR